ncbi:MAG: hypothetical protein ABJ081_07660 [Hyphomicrobiales bacterium]
MDNLIDIQSYRTSTKRKTERPDANEVAMTAEIIFFTGVRVEYENTEIIPDGPSKPKRRKLGDG